MSNLISAIRINSQKTPAKAAVIFLHGLGDTGEGWSWFPQLIKQSKIITSSDVVNYIFPNAPSIPITVNGGYVMPAWFDIYEFGNPDAKQDVTGFFKSCQVLKNLIREQIDVYGIPPEKIIIGGFSQGAAISLATVSLLDFKIGGVVALSGFCPVKKEVAERVEKSGVNFNTPIFQGHGKADPIINYQYGLQTSELYKSLGFSKLTFHGYEGVAHSADDQELIEVMKFINEIMDYSPKVPHSVLKSITSKKSKTSQLSSKDKKYLQSVEKALGSFDQLEEWADYIAFLSRLQKSLQFNPDPSIQESYYVPLPLQVANKLSLCLSSRLPSGVHQKALSIYEFIFENLPEETLNEDINIWLPGLLPLFSYSSISIKPQQIRIFKDHIVTKLDIEHLRNISKPFILSLLSGLDDENSEAFNDILQLAEDFKLKLNNDSHFWQSMFLCIISNPERRLGAFHWCMRKLPKFVTNVTTGKLVHEAEMCLKPEPGLLVRAFAVSINPTVTNEDSASDIIVVRGFFDLLLSHLPLDSSIFDSQVSAKDKEMLLMSCCRVTLKKDMSLNRRLWNYLLGPDTETTGEKRIPRTEYFARYALETLSSGLLKMVESNSIKSKVEAFKISLSIIMDKWEISTVITPRLFSRFLNIAFENKGNKELMVSASAFFDGTESTYIWNDILQLVLSDEEEKLEILDFVLKEFNFNEEEMITLHAPLAIICLIGKSNINMKRLEILESLFNLVPARAYGVVNHVNDSYNDIVDKVKQFYKARLDNSNSPTVPFTSNEISYLVVNMLQRKYIDYISDVKYCFKLSNMLVSILNIVPRENDTTNIDPVLVNKILELPSPDVIEESEKNQQGLLISFAIAKSFNNISKSMTDSQKEKAIKAIISNLWTSVYSSEPANHQVESVKTIYEMSTNYSIYSIEAGIVELFLRLPIDKRIIALETLWAHSTLAADGDTILERPLQILLDDSETGTTRCNLGIHDFLKRIIKNGGANRLLKLLTNPLLTFGFMQGDRKTLTADDDLGQFAYYLGLIIKVFESNPKLLRESCSNEFAAMDTSNKLNLLRSNDWDISTYKSLVMCVIEKFFHLQVTKEVIEDGYSVENYYTSIDHCLKIVMLLVTGNEKNFSELFHQLVSTCSVYTNLPVESYTIELIESQFLKCIFHFLEIAQESHLQLNLSEEDKEPILVNFLIQGITKSRTSILLENWVSLLTRTLYLLGDSVFNVLLSLNKTMITKLEAIFTKYSSFERFSELEDVNSCVNILVTGLEDLLSISHSYLLTSSMKTNLDKARRASSDNGFLNTMISGVFQIESPELRTTEQNKLYSIILCFQEAVRIGYHIWYWCDSRPKVPADSTFYSDRSLTFISHKLKFRAKKLLETLIELERQEIIESLIDLNNTFPGGALKLLNILDGGRSQITLPHLFNSIISRCYPQMLDQAQRSSMQTQIPVIELSGFLLSFFGSIDNDTIIDVWNLSINFFKNVLLHPGSFKDVYPDSLRICKVLSMKLKSSKIRDQKNRKELADVFSKLFQSTVTTRSSDPREEIELELKKDSSSFQSSTLQQEDTFDVILEIVPFLDEICQDSDKVSQSLNVLINSFIIPQIKSKKTPQISLRVLGILEIVGKYHATRNWKAMILDSFMDNSFFQMDLEKLKVWNSILGIWISNDREKLGDMISRITTSTQGPGNLFVWNEASELEAKVLLLKRISYLILIQPTDYFLNYLDSIFDKLEALLIGNCPDIIRSEISILFRAIVLKFNELHLLPRWAIVSHELLSIFETVANKSTKELHVLPKENLKLVLNGCKLFDQLLLCSYDEFNLHEWLFISTDSEFFNGPIDNPSGSIIDQISRRHDFTYLKDSPISLEQPQGDLRPLLEGVREIDSITKLRLFFDSLSLIQYERTYGLFNVDREACIGDVLEDLVIE
ncbi:Protein dopey [Spathaspora sp. JA1]|nr:Protein dopey [Spathaspora sp. JA1]